MGKVRKQNAEEAAKLAIRKAGMEPGNIDCAFAGDF